MRSGQANYFWNTETGSHLPSGIYAVRLEGPADTGQLMLLKL